MIIEHSFEKLLNHSIFVSKETTGIQCSRAEQEASVFLQKNILSAYTVYNIQNPKPNDVFPALKKGSLLHDFASAYVLVRSMFEAYVNMYYLLINPSSDEEREFRLDRWEKHALTERQKMAESLGSSNPILTKDKEHISRFTKNILSSEYFRNLEPSQQQSIRNSHKWTSLKVIERADKAGIHRSQSEYIYKFLSNYTHSESFSIMQLSSIENAKQPLEFCRIPVHYAEMFLALTLSAFSRLNPLDKKLVMQNEEIFNVLVFWEETKTEDVKRVFQNMKESNT